MFFYVKPGASSLAKSSPQPFTYLDLGIPFADCINAQLGVDLVYLRK